MTNTGGMIQLICAQTLEAKLNLFASDFMVRKGLPHTDILGCYCESTAKVCKLI